MQLDPQTGVSLFLPTPSVRRATRSKEARYGAGPFLPTPSVRRATMFGTLRQADGSNFYPRPP